MRSSLRTMRNLFIMIILLLILFAYAMFQGGFVSWFLFFSYLPIFIYQFGLFLYPLQDIKVSRTFSTSTIFAGDTVNVTLEFKRSLPFPLLYCLVEDKLPDSLKQIDIGPEKYRYMNRPEQLMANRRIKKIIFPLFRRQIMLTYPLEQLPRGEHLLTKVEIHTGDLFGFIKKKIVHETNTSLIVYPASRKLTLHEQSFSDHQGAIMTPIWHFHHTNLATGVREYVPGDKYSWIDWKQTAKNNHIMTKEFDQEKNQELLLIFDQTHDGQLKRLIFEAAVEVTNALINTIDKDHSHLHFLSIGKEIIHFSLTNDANIIEKVTRHLALTQPSRHRSFTNQLQHALRSFRGQANLCFITTQIDLSFVESMKQLLGPSRKIVVLLFQTQSFAQASENQQWIKLLEQVGIQSIVFTERELVAKYLEVSL